MPGNTSEPRAKVVALWALIGIVAATFLVTGVSKVAAVPPSPENFARWGFSPSFMYGIGAVEILGAVGLVVPRTSTLAALGLIATMLGAIRTGVVFHETMHVVLPSVLILLLAIIAYARRGALRSRSS